MAGRILPGLAMACLATLPVAGQAPAWWTSFTGAARMETRFVQISDSAVFGKLKRTGTLRLAKGGRLRVEYGPGGLLLVADGLALVQYDAQARTAQRVDLRHAAKDAPLLRILLDPAALDQVYELKAGPGVGAFTLEGRKPGLPRVTVEGQAGFPRKLHWTDPTGAQQVLEFLDPHVPAAAFAASVFTFKAPQGTRWLDKP